MEREELIQLIKDNTMDANEVAEYLEVSKQRISDMNRQGKLVSIKKGIYFKTRC
ncbi:putative XRE-type DNA-binding protein [Clostridium acetobutylicum]|uniref:Helix-turn-helix domain-containing protein n=1 Tax=Clostridium acetobutylicum (strain ATCC 824 / DSM 792 / JCM 1419 / IAM 19013 / LMG 5710 / NBRC 13948 / NRRL B-527 / VKM B-1787 / 2291 / W) TaxID=272562 RepID=Q97FN4_CLOAB|nr:MULTISPECIES: DNA-binding protein [Clostridium]AAK80641.1 Hypothetical protein CA_C2694 [Clostridium acetobutylicum ATCC 824]ADZ21740.1 Conserved hypothetical protein [Clostridium acetobutylicum EA 2018]AEI32503.1 hypothetical protein SMB_G2729 [Clostridium acetobutylicum DSM 1731]AWV78942.1 DNA-binding protein [Clostridium acetobutylicum]MBC2395181.1 DNA-binding protein [Clostridium acetobutylicum]